MLMWAASKKVLGSNLLAFVCGVCMQVRLAGNSKLPLGVTVSVNGCLSLCVSTVIDC